MELWIIGRVLSRQFPVAWDFLGVVDDATKAIEACTTPNHFLAPATLNVILTPEVIEWPGCHFPLA